MTVDWQVPNVDQDLVKFYINYYREQHTRFFRDAPDTDFAGYPAILKAGYRISGGAGYPATRYFLSQ